MRGTSMGNFNSRSAGAKRFKAAWQAAFLCATLLAAGLGNAGLLRAQSVPVTAGYRDFYFGKSVNGLPTGEKPQSKLWWNDGLWWGCLWDLTQKTHTIHRFNVATQNWTNTGTAIDSRVDSKGDALWDGQHLYYVSQHYTNTPGPAASADEGKLYRYSYHSISKSYSLDAGFPVIVNNSIAETLVLAKDSTGKLWVTWTEGGKVKVNRSLGNDLTWGTPFDLPVQGTDVKIDDISSILAFGGNKIGILWSNQNDKKSYFAAHLDGNADEVWEPKEQALADAALGAVSYDHLNLKPSCDNDGNVYAATKTNLTLSGLPLVYLLKRTAAGVWTRYLVSTVDEDYVRPIVLIDGEHQKIYVFAMSEATGHRIIYMKSSDLSNIAFASGLGTPFIQSTADTMIINPTSTKQCLNSATGLLVLAADQHTRTYLHNYLDLGGGTNQFTLAANTVGSGSVALGPPGGVYSAGTMVTLTATPSSGYQFSGWSGDLSGSTNPATITMNANKSVTATFTVIQHTLTVNTAGSGNVALDPPGGTYNTGTVVTLTATPSSGYQFSGWSGDLSGSTNPATITMNANKSVTATFTVIQLTLTVNTVGSGSVALDPPGGTYNTGTVVTLTATPTSGYQFSGWSGDLNGSTNPVTITMSANQNVTATFAVIQHTLTVNTVGSGSVALDPPGGTYNTGTVVTLTATPSSGYQFSGWSGDLSGSTNPATITMDANKSVTATFTPIQHTLTVNTTGSGSVALNPPGGTYNAGTVVTLTATPSSGYQFSGWSGDLSGSTNPATITMDGNKTVTATFVAIPIVHEESRTGGSSGSTTVTTLSSLTGASGHLYLVAISTRPKKLVLSVTGLGLNWTLVKSSCSGNNSTTSMEVWMAQGTPGGNGAVTATFASAPSTAAIVVSRYSGVVPPGGGTNPIGNVIAGNTNGLNGACSGGVDGNAYSFNLTTTANDAVVYGAVALKARKHTPGAGYTEQVEFQHPHPVNPIGVAVEDKSVASPASVTVNGSFNGTVDWALVALEIRPATTPPGSSIVHEESRTGGASGSTTVTTATSLAGVSGHLYLAAISTRPKKLVLSVTGLGLNWTLVKSSCAGNNTTLMEVWMAQGTPSGNGAVAATFASAPSTAAIVVSRYSGVVPPGGGTNPIGNVIGGNTNGLNGACSGGVDGNSYSFNLTTAANDAVVYSAVALKARTHTPGAGYSERMEFQHPHAVNPIGVAVEDKSVATAATVAVDGSFNGTVDWAMVALEIKPHGAIPKSFAAAENQSTASLAPAGYQLEQNYPNPFSANGISGRPSTQIAFSLPAASQVKVNIYNETGQLVQTLVDGEMTAGRHRIYWNGKNQAGGSIASGVYLYQLIARGRDGETVFSETKRMTLLK